MIDIYDILCNLANGIYDQFMVDEFNNSFNSNYLHLYNTKEERRVLFLYKENYFCNASQFRKSFGHILV